MKYPLQLCALLLSAGMLLTGCEEPSSTNTAEEFQMGNGHGNGGGTADPVWVFPASTTSKGKTVHNISVSDVDGSDRKAIYTSTGTNAVLLPTWSPSGESASLIEMPALLTGVDGLYAAATWGSYAIKAVDVAVVNGTVSSSNTRTIYSRNTSDSMRIVTQSWSPATSGAGLDKIAFIAYTPRESRIYLISIDGSNLTLIYSTTNTVTRLAGKSIAWNSDGTRIAIADISGSSVDSADRVASLKIIDLSGAVQHTVISSYKTISELQWSNAGTDSISFEGSDVSPHSSYHNKYIVNAAAGSTPALIVANDWGGFGMYWSPDNTQLVYQTKTGYSYRYNVATGGKTLVGQVPSGDWR